MYQRIIALVAGLLFTLVAVVAGVMTDLHDRSYPHDLHASSSLYLDFAPSGLSDNRALSELGDLSDTEDLGLVRILPDLAGDRDGQVFVPLGTATATAHNLPKYVHWYGDEPTGVVRSASSLTHSFATGPYLVTGSRDHLDAVQQLLTGQGVHVNRVDDTVTESASFLARQASFRTTLVAGTALMVSMALFWFTVRSKGRALRVLSGVSAVRIQSGDLGRLAVAVTAPAVPVTAAAAGWVAVRHGEAWVPYFTGLTVSLDLAVVGVTLLGALGMSLAAWPSPQMLVTRQPTVRSLRRATSALKLVTFVLVLLTAGPTWWAYGDAKAAAAQEARWQSLSDQVALRFPAGLGEDGFVRISTRVGSVVTAADTAGTSAFSYAMSPDQLDLHDSAYDCVALVNTTWLKLMGFPSAAQSGLAGSTTVVNLRGDGLRTVPRTSVPAGLPAALGADLDLWARQPETGRGLWQSVDLLTPSGDTVVPMTSAGSGDLIFPHHPLLLVVPSAATFTDDFLASASSSDNLTFTGLDPTLELLRQQGLQTTVQVKYAAQDGILRARFAAHEAWLRGFSLVALLAAFLLAIAISATTAALAHARRDYPLRLHGRSWPTILRPRLGREWSTALALTAGALLAQPSSYRAPIVLVLLLGLVGTGVANASAAQWTFRQTNQRTI